MICTTIIVGKEFKNPCKNIYPWAITLLLHHLQNHLSGSVFPIACLLGNGKSTETSSNKKGGTQMCLSNFVVTMSRSASIAQFAVKRRKNHVINTRLEMLLLPGGEGHYYVQYL